MVLHTRTVTSPLSLMTMCDQFRTKLEEILFFFFEARSGFPCWLSFSELPGFYLVCHRVVPHPSPSLKYECQEFAFVGSVF